MVLMACVLGVAGCTGGSPDAATPTGSGGSGATTSTGPTTSRSFELVGFSPLTVDVPDEPLATAGASLAGSQLEVYLAEREGQAVTVVFGLRQIRETSEPSSISSTLGEATFDNTVGGVSLLDQAALKQYLVLRPLGAAEASTGGQPGPCACSGTLGVDLELNEVVYFAASIAAPPASTTKVSFVTPVGTVPGLTLTDG
jgi:hypothetical protein